MAESLRDALGVLLGDTSGKLIALAGLLGIIVSAVISPVAGAIVAAALVVSLVLVLGYALWQRALSRGPYNVLDETITWEFPSNDGKTAYMSKRQKVRFNYLTIALIELATGDGDVFADFECNYGTRIKDIVRANEVGSSSR